MVSCFIETLAMLPLVTNMHGESARVENKTNSLLQQIILSRKLTDEKENNFISSSYAKKKALATERLQSNFIYHQKHPATYKEINGQNPLSIVQFSLNKVSSK